MSGKASPPLLVGEVFLDVTVAPAGTETKLRLGGVAHAARGFWALNERFRAAVVIPSYLEGIVGDYFGKLGCTNLVILGEIKGSPNVTLIFDPTEVTDQKYETLLRDEKGVQLHELGDAFSDVEDALIFPGSFSLRDVCEFLPDSARLHLDVAYDVNTTEALVGFKQGIETILISTSSPLFLSVGASGILNLSEAFAEAKPATIILKENRGGSRLLATSTGHIEELPAQLGTTVNSVGVGDVFDAAYLTHIGKGPIEAAWRATYSSAAYAQTTDLDLFKTYVQRDNRLSLDEMKALSGTFLPWDVRRAFPIYLAAPDFAAADRVALERAISALSYHNFNVRRPVIENGELPPGADEAMLRATYRKDYDLLKECALVFAVPTGRDPGTLVEIGLAIESSVPVVVYDPSRECANTMVIAGSSLYSDNLDACLNAVFTLLSQKRASLR
jgi:nucleoside 2-deoxyribosyltransferase